MEANSTRGISRMTEDQDQEHEFEMVMPFWIDTDAYSQRDREMFTAGVEFEQVRQHFSNPSFTGTTILRENESRIRMMAGHLGRAVKISPCEPEHDPDGTWSYLEVAPDLQEGKSDD